MSYTDRNCLTFKWTIEKASSCCHQKGEILESPSFIVKALEDTEWCLFMYPKGYQESSFLLFLKRKDNGKGPKEIYLDFELSILDEKGFPAKTFKRNRRPFYKNSSYGGSDVPIWDEIFRLYRGTYLPDDNLTICCKMWKIGEEFAIPLRCSARTKFDTEHSFDAKIPNLNIFQLGKNLGSKGIIIGSINSHNMHFLLFLTDGLSGDQNNYIEVFSTDEKIRFLTFKLYVQDSRGQKIECTRDGCGFYYRRNKTWIFPLMFSLKKFMDNRCLLLRYSILTLLCQCCFSNGQITEEFEAANHDIVASKCPASISLGTSENTANGTTTASEVLKSLYTDQILCDVKLRAQTETFPAHKNILSARSPVFKTMFSSEMRERNSQIVDIPDVDADILRYMLRYVYTESLEGLHYQSAYKLYIAADMYQIHDLRNKCSVFLRNELTQFNACDVLVLADVYQDIDLKTDVQNFIAREGKNIFTSDEWKDLIKENVQLAADTMLFKCVKE